ncbi:MAG: tetratricopeptide repeat protein, partial [Chloroflexi bacterium]|nr:tetratricopeptide repeat protein [Chloroflexota bacterium]
QVILGGATILDSAIEALSVSMLGSVGKNQQVIDLLKRETEGNVFFLVEVVRALAAEAGHLDQITQMTLPERVFAGGIQQIVERRFERVPESAHYPLRFAAVAGRQVSLEIIQNVMPDLDIETWLTECSAAAVLEVVDGQWRFAHEKLREGLIASLEDKERQKLHFQVAETLVETHGDSPDYAQVICDHYENARAIDKAAKWYVPAGKAGLKAYVFESATRYYEKAIYYWASNPDRLEDFTIEDRLEAYQGLGSTYFWQGRYDDAIGIYEALGELAQEVGDKVAYATSLRGIANCRLYMGDSESALGLLDEAEKIARNEAAMEQLATILWARGVLGYMSGDFKATVKSGEELLDIAEKLEKPVLIAQSNNLLGAVKYAQGDYQAAADHWSAQYELTITTGEIASAVAALNNLGVIAESLGDYDGAHKRYQEALRIISRTGSRDQFMSFTSNLGGLQVRRGELDDAIQNLNTVIEMAENIPFSQLSETYRFLAEALLVQQKEYEALEAVQRSLELATNVGSPDMLAGAWRVLGQVASTLIQSVHPKVGAEEYVDAQECFIQSDTICQENGLVGDRARTLREWARHEYRYGNNEDGLELWTKATQLYEQLGADLEVKRMQQGP